MTARMELGKVVPAAYKALIALDTAVGHNSLPKPLTELVRLRASQINGCAYCVDSHSGDAKAGGETDARIWAVAVWREAPCFTDAERAAFELTEALTRLPDGGDRVSDEVWANAQKYYDETSLAELFMLILTINAWNRVGVGMRLVPASFR